jgi:hypothetical protein
MLLIIKNKTIKAAVALGILFLTISLAGCYRDVISPGTDPNGPPQSVSFSGDLLPMFTKNCATAGCHDGTAHAPALTEEKAFGAISTGGYINTAVPASSPIYLVVKSGEMPPTGALKASEVQKILDWIRNGAPNN